MKKIKRRLIENKNNQLTEIDCKLIKIISRLDELMLHVSKLERIEHAENKNHNLTFRYKVGQPVTKEK